MNILKCFTRVSDFSLYLNKNEFGYNKNALCLWEKKTTGNCTEKMHAQRQGFLPDQYDSVVER